jgi:hypothetical protein
MKHVRDTATFLKASGARENRTYDRSPSDFFFLLVWFHSPWYGSESRDIVTHWPRPDGSPSQGSYNSRRLQNRDD